jgi:signal transduction histidine kinase/CheY-like chemotaxis protein
MPSYNDITIPITAGLKLVSDDLMASNSDKDSDHCETLMDVQSACRTAVEILNDLLCFDKLESGILEMHKHEVPVIPFIADCVNMFASQAREAGVTIKNTTSQGRLPPGMDANMSDSSSISALPSVMMDIIDGDIVFMDKFKMDQVLRNLISNAVKFAPRGGSVTVCASFIPGNTEDDVDESRTRRSSDVKGAKGTLPCTGWWVLLSVRWSRLVTLLNCCVRKRRVHVSVRVPDDIESGPTHLLHEYPQCLGDKMSSRLPGHENDTRINREWDHSSSAVGGLSNNNNGNNPCHGRNLTNNNTPSEAGDGLHSLNDHTPNIAGKLIIFVTDTGAGISEANQQRLFKEIVQFNPEVLQAGGGSGLGLWITSSIVQMHSGTIKAYSAGPNKGSTFTVEIDMIRRVLPNQPTQVDIQENCIPDTGVESCGAEEAMGYSEALEYLERGNEDYPLDGEIVTQSSRSSRFQPILQSSSFRIAAGDAKDHHQHDNFNLLVVDDSGLNRKLLCKLLRASGHTCEEAADGRYAVEKVKARMASASGGASTYDAILMDFVMPNMDGPTATEIIRGLGYSGPIFGVTGNALGSDVNYFISHGADAVLAKPFDYQLFKILMAETKKPTLI